MKRLRPFFSYYGSKWIIAGLYPSPQHKTIIEPFAGSAQYSLMYYNKDVVLYDLDENICMVWDYLINASEKEIMGLDTDFDCIDDLNGYTQEQKTLLGFWCAKGAAYPQRRKSSFASHSNTCDYKLRAAKQVQYIRHWKIHKACYSEIQNQGVTWFIDPPYIDKGYHYRKSKIDYNQLSQWCRSRIGSIIVCENYGADWLPFEKLCTSRSQKKGRVSQEMIYTNISNNQIPICFGGT